MRQRETDSTNKYLRCHCGCRFRRCFGCCLHCRVTVVVFICLFAVVVAAFVKIQFLFQSIMPSLQLEIDFFVNSISPVFFTREKERKLMATRMTKCVRGCTCIPWFFKYTPNYMVCLYSCISWNCIHASPKTHIKLCWHTLLFRS